MKRATAYHEAGHAVIGHVLGLPVEHVTITEDDESLGRVQHTFPKTHLTPGGRVPDEHTLRRHALASYAGPVAECGGVPDEWGGHWDDDVDLLGEIILRLAPGPDDDERIALDEQLMAEAAGLVESHWPAIEAVADALLERETLTHEALGRIPRDAPSAQRGD